MREEDIFNQTKGAYLCLIHPIRRDDIYRQEIAPVVALAPSVPNELVAAMVAGSSWRERLLGVCLAMASQPVEFIEPMLQSLRDPRGIAIVPMCAALSVLARRNTFTMSKSFSALFDRSAFNGAIGWATDKAMHVAGIRTEDVPGRGPNYGQIFEDHIEVYSWIRAS
jgi:hypothetical protein